MNILRGIIINNISQRNIMRNVILKTGEYLLIIFAIIGMLFSTLYSQESDVSDWKWVNPIPTGNDLYDAALPAPNKVVAVGGGATILITTNGGIDWSINYIKNKSHLKFNSVFFIDENIGWIVGDSGIVVTTSDGGANWSINRSISILHKLKKVFFLNSNIGWISGQNGLLLKTTDGGKTWAPQSTNTVQTLNSIYFINEATGWVCGDGSTLIRTVNGGSSWEPLTVPAYSDYFDIRFVTSNIGYLVGAKGLVAKTINAGTNWQRITTNTINSFNSIDFINSSSGIIVGNQGNWLKTSDGGENWVSDSIETKNNLYNIISKSTAGIWIVGEAGSIYSGVYTINTVWLPKSTGFRDALYSISGIDSAVLISVGEKGFVIRSINKGLNWIQQTSGVGYDLYSVAMFDYNNAIAVGDSGTIIRTTDGGVSWDQIPTVTNVRLYSVKYHNSQVLTSVGDGGTVLKSTDGGISWNIISSNPSIIFRSHCYIGGETIWAVGETLYIMGVDDSIYIGRIFLSTDGGLNWVARYSEPAPRFNDITFSSENNGIAVGNRGLIFATTDQGQTWLPRRPHNSRTNYLSVKFINDSVGFISGDDGSIIRTANGGANWVWIASGTGNSINDIYFCTTLKGWTVGNSGSILLTNTGGGDPIIIEPPPPPIPVARIIKLLPNYPNPFNDETTLAFTLNEPATVVITIYDAIGHKIRQYNLGLCESGVYDNQPGNKVAPVWDGLDDFGRKVASGCYISRLTTQKGESSHKMLFIR